MYILDDGIKLNAKLDMPKNGAEKCPICVIIHGFTGHMEERHIIAVQEAMNELGVATLRVEMYGHGGSDGEFKDHTLYKWLSNAMAAIDYARKLDFVTDVYLCGHSQGGLTAMLLAGMEKDRIKALYCPWDLDQTWGNLWAGDIVPNMVGPYYLTPENDFNLDCGYLYLRGCKEGMSFGAAI